MVTPIRKVPGFEIERWRFAGIDPDDLSAPGVFKVYKLGALVAVIREPLPLPDEPAHAESCRVDCREDSEELREFLAGYFPGETFEYFENPTWTWTHNGVAVTARWG